MEKDKVIIIGGTRKIKDNVFKKCKKCGKKTTVSGENLKRVKQKDVEVLCPDCGVKALSGKGDEKTINFPSEKDVDKFFDKYIGEQLLRKFITKTLYCKKCNTEFGHETVTGAMMINRDRVGTKDPSQSKEMAGIKFNIKKIKAGQEPPPPTSTGTMVS